jgi:hypothetical protein
LNYNFKYFEKILPCIHNFDVHPKVKAITFNIKKYEQVSSTFKKNNKNFQHSKARTKSFNLSKNKNKNLQPLKAKIKVFNLFKSKNENLQPPRAKTKAFNLFKNKNKNLQPPITKTKAFNLSKNKNKNLELLEEQKQEPSTSKIKKQKPLISKLFK